MIKWLSNEKFWKLYANQTKEFYLFLNHLDFERGLSALGFNQNLLSIDPCNYFNKIEYQLNDININSLFTIFDLTYFSSKRIYLSGHGILHKNSNTSNLIVGLPLESYIELLNFFKKINCDFLFITSCYANGVNSKIIKEEQYPFTMVISCLTDSPCHLISDIDISKFYNYINHYLETLNKNKLHDAIKLVAGCNIENLSFIKYPFQTDLKPFCFVSNMFNISKDSINCINVDSKSALLLESVRIPYIKIIGTLPKFFSLLPGSVRHEIDYLDISDFTYNDFKTSISNFKQAGNKKLFIKTVFAKNEILNNVIHDL